MSTTISPYHAYVGQVMRERGPTTMAGGRAALRAAAASWSAMHGAPKRVPKRRRNPTSFSPPSMSTPELSPAMILAAAALLALVLRSHSAAAAPCGCAGAAALPPAADGPTPSG